MNILVSKGFQKHFWNYFKNSQGSYSVEETFLSSPVRSAFLTKTKYNFKNGMDIGGGGNIVAIESGTVETAVNLGSNSFGKYVT